MIKWFLRLLLEYHRAKMNKQIAKGTPLSSPTVIQLSQKCDKYIALCMNYNISV